MNTNDTVVLHKGSAKEYATYRWKRMPDGEVFGFLEFGTLLAPNDSHPCEEWLASLSTVMLRQENGIWAIWEDHKASAAFPVTKLSNTERDDLVPNLGSDELVVVSGVGLAMLDQCAHEDDGYFVFEASMNSRGDEVYLVPAAAQALEKGVQ